MVFLAPLLAIAALVVPSATAQFDGLSAAVTAANQVGLQCSLFTGIQADNRRAVFNMGNLQAQPVLWHETSFAIQFTQWNHVVWRTRLPIVPEDTSRVQSSR